MNPLITQLWQLSLPVTLQVELLFLTLIWLAVLQILMLTGVTQGGGEHGKSTMSSSEEADISLFSTCKSVIMVDKSLY